VASPPWERRAPPRAGAPPSLRAPEEPVVAPPAPPPGRVAAIPVAVSDDAQAPCRARAAQAPLLRAWAARAPASRRHPRRERSVDGGDAVASLRAPVPDPRRGGRRPPRRGAR